MVAVDTLFYSAIGPLLPLLASTHELSTAQLGLVSGAFGAGAIAGALLSAYLVGRMGVRPVAVVGLLTLAVASLAFGFVDGFGALALARLVAGASSALSWGAAFAWLVLATPHARRGRAIGTLFGTSVIGAATGPALGSLAATVGLGIVFTGIACLAVLIGLWALAEPAAAPGPSASELSLATARTIVRPALAWGLGVAAQAAGQLGDAAAAATLSDEAQASIGAFAVWDVEVALGSAWAASAAGEATRARELALEAAGQMEARGQLASEVIALHDAVRLGAASKALPRLRVLSAQVEGAMTPLVTR
ncbi:MFS transporter, partial [Nocardioides sp.]|uniref:MFS transporter n=1 Tax=Nocardioides sp. TaxID=35761 RepID=UPI00286E194E